MKKRLATPTLELTCNHLKLRLVRPSLALHSLRDGGSVWLDNGPAGAPLWQLHAVDAEGWRVALDGSKAGKATARASNGGILLEWKGVTDPAKGAGPFDVAVTIRPLADRPSAVAWQIHVRNRSRKWTLWTVTFPILSGLVPAGNGKADRMFYPHGWGMEQSDLARMTEIRRRYPRGWDFSMQFMGYTRGVRTLYVGAHDPRLTTKEFLFRPESQPGGAKKARFSITNFPENMSKAGNGFDMGYDTVVAVIPGGWYDAARLYGDWARRQPWVSAPPPAAPREPRRDREIHAWQVLSFPDKPAKEWGGQMETLVKKLGVRFGIHFYNWHQVPFDTSYPDYFPARKEFKPFVARMKRAGIITMPYINGRLWDVNSRTWPARRAERFSVKYSMERVNPRTLIQHLEEYGNGQKLAPMCPATPFWQDTVVELCRWIVKGLGCDGVYIDQIGAEKGELCFNPAHGHPLGGGGYWLEGYRRMAAKIRQAVGPHATLTTECNWEGCIADFELLLSWAWFTEQDIPLFPAAYSGVTQNFGSQFNAAEIEQDGGRVFARKMARLFVWGAQLGWGDLTPLLKKEHTPLLAFLRTLCVLREENAGTFAAGRMQRPPAIRGASRDILCSVWESADGRATTLFSANPTRKPARTTVVVGGGRLQVALPPLGARAYPLR